MTDSNKILEFDVKPCLKDYISFNKLINKKFMFRVYMMVLLFITILGVLILNNDGVRYDKLLQALAVIIMVILLLNYSIRLNSKRAFENNSFSKEKKHYTITEEFLDGSAESGTVKVTWDKINKVEETKECIIIFIAKTQGFIIPKSCLQNEEQLRLLKEFISKKLNPKIIKFI